jgi:MOSC domain-containing protein YiiM
VTEPVAALPYRTTAELERSLHELRAAPTEQGRVHLVVRRPGNGDREVLDEGYFDAADGLAGDNWLSRATSRAVAAGRHLDAQVNVMSARMVRLLADTAEEQAYAGDQLFVDLDISVANLPAGSRLAFGAPGAGGAVMEISQKPHNGCAKFTTRFGEDAMRFVNSEAGKELRLRGFNARIVESGPVRPGDVVRVVRRGGLDDQTELPAQVPTAV